jgi:hypothetical protein
MKLRILAFWLVSFLCGSLASADEITQSIMRIYASSAVFIDVEDRQPGGATICRSGTGFIIGSSGYVLTTLHLIKGSGPSQTTTEPSIINIKGTIGKSFDCHDPSGDIKRFTIVVESALQDTVLLKTLQESGPFTPISVCKDTIISPGSTAHYVGFSSTGALPALTPTQVTLESLDGARGFWTIASEISPSAAGSPFFNENGRLVGMVDIDIDSNKPLGRVVPIQHLYGLFEAAGVSIDVCRTPLGIDSGQACEPTLVPYDVNALLDTHETEQPIVRPYSTEFYANSGYKIKSYVWTSLTAKSATDVDIEINSDHTAIRFQTSLSSGPFYDRWRGWLRGRIDTIQVPKDCF